MLKKPFYIVSALKTNSCPISQLKKFNTKDEAINHAKQVIKDRVAYGSKYMPFYILKVDCIVGLEIGPVKVTDFDTKD